MNRALIVAAVALSSVGCKEPLHLSYDYGRAFVETLKVQSDLTRPSVQYDSYALYGLEAAAIRVNVEQAATDQEDATSMFEANE